MIPQTYELWLADYFDDKGPNPIYAGRVIGWHFPEVLNDASDAEQTVPLVAYENPETGESYVHMPNKPWFLGSTRAEAYARAETHLKTIRTQAATESNKS